MNPESTTEQAAEWAARLDAGPLSRAEAEALLGWLEADRGNEGRLEEIQRVHQQVRLILPAMAAAGQLPEIKSRPAWRPALAWTASIAAVLAVGIFWLVQRPVTFATTAAQRQVVILGDGTRAELNARTTLRVQLRGPERRVRLEEGEVFLAVARNAERPFVVETAAGQVRVTGTVFNVSTPSPDSLGVLLLEGGVEATPVGGEPRRLVPGDELVVAAGRAEVHRLGAAELADAMAWREGRIVFHETPLALALARFAHHHDRRIEVSPEVRDLALGGRFVLDDFDGFLRDLAVALPVMVRRDAAGVVFVEPVPAEGK